MLDPRQSCGLPCLRRGASPRITGSITSVSTTSRPGAGSALALDPCVPISDSGVSQQRGRHRTSLADDLPLARNLEALRELERESRAARTLTERFSDAVTNAIGSVGMVAFHVCLFIVWFVWNSRWIPGLTPFDPFPFGILTLIVSAEGVLLAVFVLISQNRMMRDADRRAQLDLQINLLCEQSTTTVLQVVDRIAQRLDVPGVAGDPHATHLAKPTDIGRIARALSREDGGG